MRFQQPVTWQENDNFACKLLQCSTSKSVIHERESSNHIHRIINETHSLLIALMTIKWLRSAITPKSIVTLLLFMTNKLVFTHHGIQA